MTPRAAARLMGRRGGLARARRLPAEERRRIASLGGLARRHARLVEQRLADNLAYAAAASALRARRPNVVRMRAFDGPLPGLSPGRR